MNRILKFTLKLSLKIAPVFLFLCGCATPIQYVRKNPKKQAVLRYARPESKESETEFKANLNKQASSFCEGGYKIKNEQHAISDGSTPTNIDPASTVFLSDSENRLAAYNYVEIECEK